LGQIIRLKIETADKDALRASALGKAAHHALGLCWTLAQILEYPEIELTDNLDSTCPAALGRKC
jgi:hypothetical protein